MQKFHRRIRDRIKHEFTIHHQGQGDAHDPPPWALCPAGGGVEHSASSDWEGDLRYYYTGETHHVIIDTRGGIFIGRSVCSVKDQFRKKTGHLIAKGRAEKAAYEFYNWDAVRKGTLQSHPINCPVEARTVFTNGGREFVGFMLRGGGSED